MMPFPTCFLIHCRETADDPPGRTELIRAHFAEHGIEPIWIRGIHGNTWGLDTRFWSHRQPAARDELIEGCRQVLNLADAGLPDAELVEEVYRRIIGDHRSAYRIGPGHIGLCLSHWLCWSLAFYQNLQEVLICEDDVTFEQGFREKFDEHRAQLPADWQIWYAGSVSMEPTRQARGPIYTLPREMYGTHCMLVRRSALAVLLDTCCQAREHVDILISRQAAPRLKCYASYPPLARQKSADDIWPHAVGGYA